MRSLAATLLLLAACRTNAPIATDADAARAAARWPGTTAEDLNRGRSLFMGHCGTCHQPPRPSKYSVDEWPGHVAEMRERAGLSFDEQQLVEHYVVTMASAE